VPHWALFSVRPIRQGHGLSVERRLAAVDALMTVTLLPWDSSKWLRTFHPELVAIEWKGTL